MKKILLLYLLFYSASLFCQGEGNIWYFGDSAGVDFNTGNPLAISGGQTHFLPSSNYSEGTASISDGNGNLLMYTDGQTLWNSNHQTMLNGDSLYGNFSSTQSAIIIPQPNSSHLYYVFTADDVWESTSNYGLRFSIVDMCGDNNLGRVLPSTKNTLLLNGCYEKIAAVRHSNGIDYWIVTHLLNTNQFYSFLLDHTGISDTVISSIGATSTLGQGQLKISPNGQKIAVAHNQHWWGIGSFELFDFNNMTGIISNPITLAKSSYDVQGIEFSPNNSLLYAVYSSVNPIELKIVQFDLSSGIPNTINNSQTTVYQSNSSTLRSLQLGPNNKIYMVAFPYDNFLLSINNPNTVGSGCNVQDNDISLGSYSGSVGLPSFVAGYSYNNLNFSSCEVNITENKNENKIELTPNPTTGQITISLEGIKSTFVIVRNSLGQQVLSEKFRATDRLDLDLSAYPDGIYFIQLEVDGELITKKVVKN